MSKPTAEKKKVFLCYAREDQTLMDDFYNRFKNYNEADMEILIDRTSVSQNMHEVFHTYAKECDVAVLLVNARFVNPTSYANQNEVPILVERQKEGKIVIVGVRLSYISDLEKWNREGDVYFLSLTNNDLPNTRIKKPEDGVFHREYAVYEQVDEKDLNQFHGLLHKWILECLNKNQSKQNGNSAKTGNIRLRDPNVLDKILSSMNPNSLLYKLEKTLSTDKSFWDNAGIPIPSEESVWSFLYCKQQAEKFEAYQNALCKITSEDPLIKLTKQFDKVEKRTNDIRKLLDSNFSDEDGLDEELEKQLSKIDRVLEKSMEKVIASPRKNHTEAKSDLSDAIEELRNFLKLLAGNSLGGS